MQFWVYILRCDDGSYYAGHTDDLEKRMWEHEHGKGSTWTRTRRPVELLWCSDAPTRYEALAFERRIKNWSRAKKEALMAGDWAAVGHFARPPHERPSTEFILSVAAGGVEGLRTNEAADLQTGAPGTDTFVPSEVEGRTTRVNAAQPAPAPHERPSTSLRTNEAADLHPETGAETDAADTPDSFVPSVVEGRTTDASPGSE